MKAAIAPAVALLLAVAVSARSSCPPPSGPNWARKNLRNENFSRQNLQGADFTGSDLAGAQFIGTDLTGAIFPNANIGVSDIGPTNFSTADLTRACFQDSRFAGTNFDFATLTCADFSRTDLTGVDFGAPVIGPAPDCRAKFNFSKMRIGQIPVSLWRHTDFTGTNFIDLTPGTFSFIKFDATDAILAGQNLAGFDFTGATLIRTDLSQSDLRGATFNDAVANEIKLDGARFDLGFALGMVLTDAKLRNLIAPRASFKGARMQRADLRGAVLTGAGLDSADLSNAVLEPGEGLEATQLSGADLTDAKLDAAHLNGVRFQTTRLIRASITNVAIAGTDFSNATMPNVKFDGSRIEGVSFRGSSLENASFKNVTFAESKNPIQIVDFTCTQLGGADLRIRAAEGITFVGAVLPDQASCIPDLAIGFYCGSEPAASAPYPPTILPTLMQEATCPDGVRRICRGTEWLLPQWKTTACNSDGRLETRWTPPVKDDPPPKDVVEIPDANFKKCLQKQLFGGREQEIPPELAKTVGEINCPSLGIKSAKGLEAFTGLRKLNLSANLLTDGQLFTNLVKLQVLQVSNNQLESLNVRNLKDLTYLNAAHNQLPQVIGLVFADLRYLDLSFNKLPAFNLRAQKKLFYADVSHNALTDTGGVLTDLTELVYLYLQNNDLTTIGPLKALAAPSGKLAHLDLGSNSRFQCKTLELEGTDLLKASNCKGVDERPSERFR